MINNTGNWIAHIIAGILGVIFSLSIVYMKLEKRFSVHQTLSASDIVKITDASGRSLEQSEIERFVKEFNALTFLGANTKYTPNMTNAIHVELVRGINLYCATGEKFIEVMKVDRKGKRRYYWLLGNDSAKLSITG